MASNYTSNYRLNQWAASDKVLRTEFNSDNAKIDAAVKAVDVRVDSKADQSALDAEISARTAAVAAIQTTLLGKGNCRIETFTYTGTGTASHTRTFSGQPVFFLLAGPDAFIFGGAGAPANGLFNIDGRAATSSPYTAWDGCELTVRGDERAVANHVNYTYLAVALYKED